MIQIPFFIGQAAAVILTMFYAAACPDNTDVRTGNTQEQPAGKVWYTNPVINRSAPDPTVIRANDGTFYLYATGGNPAVYKSANLYKWDYVGTAFTKKGKPAWEPKAGIWAPDINYINGKYVLYYSMSVWGGGKTCGLGVAVSDTPEGPFTDLGKLFRSNEIGVHNSIDPFYIEDNGKKYLFWGSWNGIWGVELTDDGLALKGGIDYAKKHKVQIAGTAYEATYILKRDGHYYLFNSIGSCCNGARSTYTTVVGRADNLFGPYVNKAGERMMDNKHEIFIKRNDAFLGTGHNAEFVQDDNGNDWVIYHAFRTDDVHAGRVDCLDRVYWTEDGWPYLSGNGPAVKAEAPVFIQPADK